MKVYYKFYELSTLRASNRLTSSTALKGVHLRIDVRRDKSFADFFSHPSLGDLHIEEFLEKFKYQDDEMSKKTFHFLLNDVKTRYQQLQNLKTFKNHSLWHKDSKACDSEVFKYKLIGPDDFGFLSLLRNKKRVRLDANGLFSLKDFQIFSKEIDPDLLAHIEYIEDPTHEPWPKDSPIKLASDFILDPEHSIRIHKPNRSFIESTPKPMVFSSYMGGLLGQWHSYCELMEKGDLNLYHGIHVENFYHHEIFSKTSHDTYAPLKTRIKSVYEELVHSQWKTLCSI